MEVLRWTAEHFNSKSIASPRLDAELIIAHALGLRRIDLYMRPELPLNESERDKVRELIRLRLEGEPVAYITGQKEFWAMPFKVTRKVLVPRPETEEVVEQAHLLFLPRRDEPLRIMELGTGSGCISAALAKEFPHAQIIATDISSEAIDVARENLAALGFGERVIFKEGDLYDALEVSDPDSSGFDLIISNPPYVPTAEIESLAPEVKCEPFIALDGGPDGADIIRNIIAGSDDYLAPGGYLVIEIHEAHEMTIRQINQNSPHLLSKGFRKDLAGLTRVTWWQKRP